MADVKWIKITTNVFDDEKMKLIDVLPERDAIIVIWFKLLTLAGKINDNGKVYIMEQLATTDEVLATVFNRPITVVRLALQTFVKFRMIEMNEHINIVNWEKHQNIEGLEKIREQTRKRVEKHREKQKQIKCNVTVTDGNAIDKNRIDKNRIDKNRIEIETEIETETETDTDTDKKKNNIYPDVFYKVSDKLQNKLKEFVEYRKEIKKSIKTERVIKGLIENIGKEYTDEEHLIQCINYAMNKEYCGIKGEYVKYKEKKGGTEWSMWD